MLQPLLTHLADAASPVARYFRMDAALPRAVCVSLLTALATGTTVLAAPHDTPVPVAQAQEGQNTAPRIRSVEISPATRGLSTSLVTEVAARAAVGKPADAETIAAAAAAVVALYRANGLPAARVVETDITPEGILRLTVAEGTIGRILIIGNRRTRSSTILSVLSMRPGDLYRERGIRDDRDRLARLGIFSDVSLAARGQGVPEAEEDLAEERGPEAGGGGRAPGKIGEGPGAETPATGTPVAVPGKVPEKDEKMPGEADEPSSDPEKTQGDAGKEPAQEPAKEEKKPPKPPYIVTLKDPLPEDLGLVDLVVKVEERPTVNIAATLGYADGTGALGFVDLSEMNLAGTGQRLALQWQRSAQSSVQEDGSLRAENARSAFGIAYEMPALGARSTAIGLEVYDKNTVFLPFFSGGQETIRSFERRRGGRARAGRQLGDDLAVFGLLRRDQVGYDAVPERLNPPAGDIANAAGIVAAWGVQVISDRRDTADNPSHGSLNSLIYENATSVLGGNRNFQQVRLDLRQYIPMSMVKPGAVFALRLLGGTSSGDVPLSEQFFLGGFELLRGYDLYSIRGDRMALATAEARFPIGQGLQGVIFTDVGNAWRSADRIGAGGLRTGFGAGVRFLSPIGPIRLDAAYGNRLQTYVSLGQSF